MCSRDPCQRLSYCRRFTDYGDVILIFHERTNAMSYQLVIVEQEKFNFRITVGFNGFFYSVFLKAASCLKCLNSSRLSTVRLGCRGIK